MKLVPKHPATGKPAILGDDGLPMDTAAAVRAIRRALGLSVAAVGEACGVSPRTVEGWEQGKPMRGPAVLALGGLLARAKN